MLLFVFCLITLSDSTLLMAAANKVGGHSNLSTGTSQNYKENKPINIPGKHKTAAQVGSYLDDNQNVTWQSEELSRPGKLQSDNGNGHQRLQAQDDGTGQKKITDTMGWNPEVTSESSSRRQISSHSSKDAQSATSGNVKIE